MTQNSKPCIKVPVLALAAVFLLALQFPSQAGDPNGATWTKSSEVNPSDVEVAAFDLQEGVLYFRIDGRNFYFEPPSENKALRISAATAILSELRKAKTVVLSYSDEQNQVRSRYFPAYAPFSQGTSYNPLGAFFFRY